MEVTAEFALGYDHHVHGADHTPPPTVVASPSRAAAYDHAVGLLLLRRTAQQAPRTTTTTASRRTKTAAAAAGAGWRCRVCQVECVGRDGLRKHCMSDEHFQGLQLFALRPDLFPDPIDL